MIFDEKGPDKLVVRLEAGEDILAAVRSLAVAKKIMAATLEGIGSLNRVKLGHYDFATKKYRYETFEEDLEILTLSGTIASLNESPLPHIHVTLGRRDFTVIGGHLDEGSAANMVEISVTVLPGKLVKAKDEKTGLNLFQLSHRV